MVAVAPDMMVREQLFSACDKKLGSRRCVLRTVRARLLGRALAARAWRRQQVSLSRALWLSIFDSRASLAPAAHG